MKIKVLAVLIFALYGKILAQPNWAWGASDGGVSQDYGYGIATDPSGNVFVTGIIYDDATFGSTYLTSNYGDIFLAKYDASGNLLWAKNFGGGHNEVGYGVSTDANGNAFVTGRFSGSPVAFGTTTLTAVGLGDVFLVKFDPSGNPIWAKSSGGNLQDYGYDVSTDKSGNPTIVGAFNSPTIIFGSDTLINAGANDNIFIAKYDTAGNVLWAKSAGGTLYDYVESVATDINENVLITGKFLSSPLTFGNTTLTSVGGHDVFTVKYDKNGNVLWAKSVGGTGNDYSDGIATDKHGSVYVTGQYCDSSIILNGINFTSAGACDLFLLKYDSSGNTLWARTVGGVNSDHAQDLATDMNGNVFMSGIFASPTINFGSITLTSVNPLSYNGNIFLAKYDSSGNVVLAKSSSGVSSSSGTGYGVATDLQGSAFVTGFFRGPTISFGSVTLTNTDTMPWAGNADVYLLKFGNTTSIEKENNVARNLTIFPNPSSGTITLLGTKQNEDLLIFNSVGQNIITTKALFEKTEIDLSNQPKGIYFVQLKSSEETITKKLILK